jgi:hypothetical protein
MHRAVLGPTPRPTGGHEPGPFKQTRNGPLTGMKRPNIISQDHGHGTAARSRTPALVLVHTRDGEGPFIRLSRNPKIESVSVSPCLAAVSPSWLPESQSQAACARPEAEPPLHLHTTRRPEQRSPAAPARCAACAPAACPMHARLHATVDRAQPWSRPCAVRPCTCTAAHDRRSETAVPARFARPPSEDRSRPCASATGACARRLIEAEPPLCPAPVCISGHFVFRAFTIFGSPV